MDKDAYRHGIKMHDGGYGFSECPIGYDDASRLAWQDGWLDGQRVSVDGKIAWLDSRGAHLLDRDA